MPYKNTRDIIIFCSYTVKHARDNSLFNLEMTRGLPHLMGNFTIFFSLFNQGKVPGFLQYKSKKPGNMPRLTWEKKISRLNWKNSLFKLGKKTGKIYSLTWEYSLCNRGIFPGHKMLLSQCTYCLHVKYKRRLLQAYTYTVFKAFFRPENNTKQHRKYSQV